MYPYMTFDNIAPFTRDLGVRKEETKYGTGTLENRRKTRIQETVEGQTITHIINQRYTKTLM